MREIPLTRGQVTVVDDADYEWLSQWKWHANGPDALRFYARRFCTERHKNISMHRLLMGFPQGLTVDHIDGDRLNNRRANLRVATVAQNVQNIPKSPLNCDKTQFKGAYFHKASGLWWASLIANGKSYSGGYHHTDALAARAYDELAKAHHGEFARLNFPNED